MIITPTSSLSADSTMICYRRSHRPGVLAVVLTLVSAGVGGSAYSLEADPRATSAQPALKAAPKGWTWARICRATKQPDNEHPGKCKMIPLFDGCYNMKPLNHKIITSMPERLAFSRPFKTGPGPCDPATSPADSYWVEKFYTNDLLPFLYK